MRHQFPCWEPTQPMWTNPKNYYSHVPTCRRHHSLFLLHPATLKHYNSQFYYGYLSNMFHHFCHQNSDIHRLHDSIVNLRASLLQTSHIALTSTWTLAQSTDHCLYIAHVLNHFSTYEVVLIMLDLSLLVSSSTLSPNTFHFMRSTHRPHKTILTLNNHHISSCIQYFPLISNHIHRGTNTLYNTSIYNNRLFYPSFDHNCQFILSYRDQRGVETLNTISTHAICSMVSWWDSNCQV
jgi:hypothetical protein